MDLYYNLTRQCRVNEDNCVISGRPVLYLGARPELVLHFYTGEPGFDPVPADLSGVAAWRAAVDADWNSATDPMCRTLPEDIDAASAASGVIKLPLDTCTVRFAEALGNRQSLEACFELRGFDASGAAATVILFNVICHNAVDADGGAALDDVPSDVPTKSWILAVLSGYTAATESINNLTIRVGSAETAISGATASIAALGTAIEGATVSIAGLTARMDSAETAIAATTVSIAGLTTSVSALADDVAELEPVTAFEVYAHDEDIPAGEYCAALCKTGDVVSQTIPACMKEHFIIGTEYPAAAQDVVIEWGDGSTERLADVPAAHISGANRHLFHEYATPGKYIVRITGTTYAYFRPGDDQEGHSADGISQTGYGNLLCRIFDYDLPVASHLTNFSGACRVSPRLLYVDFSRSRVKQQARHCDNLFYQSRNLLSAVGFYDHRIVRISNAFSGCTNLVTTDFVLPAVMSGDGPNMLFNGCKKLVGDIASFFPTSFAPGNPARVVAMFYSCLKLTGTVPADKLWNSPYEWTLGASGQLPFLFCSAAIRAQVPQSWGGTASDDIIKVRPAGTVYVTGGTGSNVTLALGGGTHWTFEQPLEGLTVSNVENSHYESEIVFTGGTALNVDIPASVSVIEQPNFEAGKSYVINVRDNILVAAEYTPGVTV